MTNLPKVSAGVRVTFWTYHQRLPDSQADRTRRSTLENLDSLGQTEHVQLGAVDRHKLVSREQTTVELR